MATSSRTIGETPEPPRDPDREAQAFPLVRQRGTALEQYLDRGVARRARRSRRRRRRPRAAPPSTLAASNVTAPSTLARVTDARGASALARVTDGRVPSALARATDAEGWLMWRGRAVTPEFQRYALRVERGERCPPYRGRVLAGPAHDFPWDLRHTAERRGEGWSAVQCAVTAALLCGVLLGGAATLLDQRDRAPDAAPSSLAAPLWGLLRGH